MLKNQTLKTKFAAGLIALLVPLAGQAQESVDLQNLEKSYWSAKDNEFSVVQNRAFSKKGRYSFTAQYGIPINDPYSEGSLYKGEVDYYWNEHWGMGLKYEKMDLVDNNATNTFINDHRTVPNHNVLKSFTAGSIYYAPLYAKMSFLDKKIIYFDMGVGLHAGSVGYEVQRSDGNAVKSTIGYGFSIFQQFYANQHWSFRWDFQTLYSSQERQRYRIGATESESARSLGDKTLQNTSLSIGITYWK
ncbi:MAG: outer membrane beta-barrel domain-containing protein [Bdellovibrionota bacterium]